MSALLPCPFCGGDAEIDTRRGYRARLSGEVGTGIAVYCRECDADMMRCRADTPEVQPEEIIAAWNRRAMPTREELARVIRNAWNGPIERDTDTMYPKSEAAADAALALLGKRDA